MPGKVPIWQWRELLEACQLTASAKGIKDIDICGISIDSRTLQPGDLFVALSGDPGPGFHSSGQSFRDGHEFISAAIDNGAAALLVDKNVVNKNLVDQQDLADIPALFVEDTLAALWDLGIYSGSRTSAKKIAITGSSGKTTARHFIQRMLETQGVTHASTGSFNNHWGVPLSLARMPKLVDFGVFEIGMNHPGEIAPLSRLVSPDVALILNVLPVHLEYFKSLDEIRKEKLSIIEGLANDGVLIVPDDLDLSDHVISSQQQIITFGLTASASVYPISISKGKTWEVEARVVDENITFGILAGGIHRVQTALAGLAVIKALRGNLIEATDALASIEPPIGRGNWQTLSGVNVIDDSYNANPESMKYALQGLGALAGRNYAILGDMLELGDEADRFHKELAADCTELEGVITVGKQMNSLAECLAPDKIIASYDEASQIDLSKLVHSLREGDNILIKGSNKIFWQNQFVQKLITAFEK